MDTIVLKFGGSSVSDNIKLNIVADKIKEFYKENNVVVVVSAQGKTTDNLLREAHELSNVPNERELDTLLSAGEQISMSKLSILLNRLGYPAISLTGWQAGIFTNNVNQNAIIENIIEVPFPVLHAKCGVSVQRKDLSLVNRVDPLLILTIKLFEILLLDTRLIDPPTLFNLTYQRRHTRLEIDQQIGRTDQSVRKIENLHVGIEIPRRH